MSKHEHHRLPLQQILQIPGARDVLDGVGRVASHHNRKHLHVDIDPESRARVESTHVRTDAPIGGAAAVAVVQVPNAADGKDTVLSSKPFFSAGGPKNSDADQAQGIADCYLFSALAAVAYEVPGDLLALFRPVGSDNYCGRWWKSGVPSDIVQDRLIPATCAERNPGYWAGFAEKQWAAVRTTANTYKALAIGSAGSVWTALGRKSDWEYIKAVQAIEAIIAANDVAGLPQTTLSINVPAAGSGILGNHIYQLLGYDATLKLVITRNPLENAGVVGIQKIPLATYKANFLTLEWSAGRLYALPDPAVPITLPGVAVPPPAPVIPPAPAPAPVVTPTPTPAPVVPAHVVPTLKMVGVNVSMISLMVGNLDPKAVSWNLFRNGSLAQNSPPFLLYNFDIRIAYGSLLTYYATAVYADGTQSAPSNVISP